MRVCSNPRCPKRAENNRDVEVSTNLAVASHDLFDEWLTEEIKDREANRDAAKIDSVERATFNGILIGLKDAKSRYYLIQSNAQANASERSGDSVERIVGLSEGDS